MNEANNRSYPLTLTMKLGSLAVHADELLTSLSVHDGNAVGFDSEAIRTLLTDAEVVAFLQSIDPALLPVKRG